MAIDDAILTAVEAGEVPPTLRFYAWNPPCLSLGYGQRYNEVDVDRLRERGWDIVRRPTGGRAILHQRELTYSLALPIDHPLAHGSVIESYLQISTALMTGLHSLGMQPRADRMSDNAKITPVCFETPSHYEVTVNGKKLIGSAQVRRQQGILQHGSLPLTGDIAEICDFLVYPDEAARADSKVEVRAHAATLLDVFTASHGSAPTEAEIIAHLSAAFNACYERLTSLELTPNEQANVERLTRDVYGNPDWTFRR